MRITEILDQLDLALRELLPLTTKNDAYRILHGLQERLLSEIDGETEPELKNGFTSRPNRYGVYDGSLMKMHSIRLDRMGYDKFGTLFGTGRPLYWCSSEDGEVELTFRADNRREAKRYVHEKYPTAKFKK
jgi:hypothetical protein